MSSSNALRMMAPLSDAELDELDEFLMSDVVSDEAMMLDMLDGYLTAIVVGPTTLQPSQWLPGIWGAAADDAPQFETMEQAQRILDLILRHYNGIIWSLKGDAEAFEPFFNTTTYPEDDREYIDGESWAYGFMQGIALCRSDWQPLFDDAQGEAWLRPMYLLGADEVSPDEEKLTDRPAQREDLSRSIPAGVAAIYRYWLPYRKAVSERQIATTIQRRTSKIGRNDPCPCGSGKKFKKCCGAAAELH
ncbi:MULTISPECIES: UPF0149 family protein [unclassified Caballeronia]|uniref:UPF0149 family protein n=1 Tax=unclassified Caballeronia TaxID=2646786 RepID=UPI0020291A4B|nr:MULTISPECIES: UPF0149 family protein [unclassified Caballeronia]